MAGDMVSVSKFLSLILRHEPGKIGLELDDQGWASIDELLAKAHAHGRRISRELLDRVVAENDKQRFAISPDGTRIRANQGHSVSVELGLPPQQPPELLFHGTASRTVESIRQTGLHSGSRQHVHLSLDVATAIQVGQRHGKPVVLTIRAGEMWRAGSKFFLSANGVWLTEEVPASFIDFPDQA